MISSPKRYHPRHDAALALADGRVFRGRGFGARVDGAGEVGLHDDDDRLSGSLHGSVIQGPTRLHDVSVDRQLWRRRG